MRGKISFRMVLGIGIGLLALGGKPASAQTDLSLYSDQLDNGWQNWSWDSTTVAAATPAHTGANSLGRDLHETMGGAESGLSERRQSRELQRCFLLDSWRRNLGAQHPSENVYQQQLCRGCSHHKLSARQYGSRKQLGAGHGSSFRAEFHERQFDRNYFAGAGRHCGADLLRGRRETHGSRGARCY